MGSLFGGSKSKSQSTSQSSSSSNAYNQAYGQLNNQFSPMLGLANQGGNALAALLGGDASGFNNFKNATGFNAMADLGSRGITGNAAAGGLLRSGSTAKGLQAFGNTLQNQYANNYMDRLLGQAQLGMQAGHLISGAGNVSNSQSQSTGVNNSTSNSKNGLGGLVGGIASGIAASDKRLKKNIHKVGELTKDISIYQYRYTNGEGPYIGVMAQEVAQSAPEALGPMVDGYMTVNYDKLKETVNGQPA